MRLLTTLVFTCALAEGHRIHRSSQFSNKDVSADIRDDYHDVSAAGAGHNSDIQQVVQTTFNEFAHSASMIQEQASMASPDDCEEKTHKDFSQTPAKQEIGIDKTFGFALHEPKWVIVLASVLLCLICCGCCWCFRRHRSITFSSRLQHIHKGRRVYEWDQTSKVVTLYLKPPEGVRKNDLDILIAAKHIRVGRKNKPSFLMEETYDYVHDEMSYWTLRNNGELQIVLRKVQKADWPVALLHTDDGNAEDRET